MSDVRLTATNPVDSSVVPVACNEKGELKLEEPLINSDEFVAKAGDTMTGNLHLGDGITLNPDGSAQLASGGVDIYDTGKMILGDKITLDADGSAAFAGGEIELNSDGSVDFAGIAEASSFEVAHTAQSGTSARIVGNGFSTNGVAPFGSSLVVHSDNDALSVSGNGFIIVSNNSGNIFAVRGDGCTAIGGSQLQPNILLNHNGSAAFVGDVIVGSRGKQWMIVESNGLAHLVEQTRFNEISTADEVGTADLVNPDSNEISTADLASATEYPPLRDIPGELTMVEQQLQKVLEKLRMVPEAGWEVWDGSD